MRKKILLCLILCIALCMALTVSAQAAGLDYVTDAAGILTVDERLALNDQAAQVSDYYGCGVYIVVVDDYKNYVRGDIQEFSETVYSSYFLGVGEDKDGILLSLSMAERDYDLCAYGDFAHYAFTDYGKDKLAETFLDNFRNNDWVGGFNDYIANSISLMDMAKQGNPLDIMVYDEVPEQRGWDAFEIVIILAVSCAAGFIVCGVLTLQMKNTGRKQQASEYMRFSMGNMRIMDDQFLRRDVRRVRISRDDDGGGRPGGHFGGTSINSGGFSHKGGKF